MTFASLPWASTAKTPPSNLGCRKRPERKILLSPVASHSQSPPPGPHEIHLRRLRLYHKPYCLWYLAIIETIENFLLHCPRFHSYRVVLRIQLQVRTSPHSTCPPCTRRQTFTPPSYVSLVPSSRRQDSFPACDNLTGLHQDT